VELKWTASASIILTCINRTAPPAAIPVAASKHRGYAAPSRAGLFGRQFRVDTVAASIPLLGVTRAVSGGQRASPPDAVVGQQKCRRHGSLSGALVEAVFMNGVAQRRVERETSDVLEPIEDADEITGTG
jgi:hypothetical protein